MKNPLLPLLTLSLFLGSFTSFSQAKSKLVLGTVKSVLSDLNNQNKKSATLYTLKLNTNDVAEIDLENYYNENGRLSMNGLSKESKNSLFILKGDESSLYGYLVLHETKKAFEITTNNGEVSIEEIDIAKIYPDLYETMIVPKVESTYKVAINPKYSPMAQRQVIHIGPYNNEDVTKLQSKPGSKYVFYLNHSAVMNGTTPKNGRGKDEMYRVWQCTADQYSMYDLNITTDPAVYAAAKSADVLKTGNMTFVDQDGRSNACVACFGTTASGTLYRDPGNGDYGYGIGMTCAHEMGHQMGMLHDGGGSGGEYFEGISAVQWCPIMGNYWQGGGWANAFFTWSKGEYNTASQKEDDLKIMNVNEKVPYMVDDIPSSVSLKIKSAGVISPSENWGQIAQNTDTDAFTFEVGSAGGTLNLLIDPIEYLRQLDVAAKIINSTGAVVASSNKAVHRSAEFKNLSLPVGSYSLVIQGGAELTPQTGFSNYSSLGYYAMEGTLTGAVSTAIGETQLGDVISYWPTPAEDKINLHCASIYNKANLTLTTASGEEVFVSNEFVKSIDISNLSQGIYFLKITVDGQSCVKKILKM